MLARENLVEIFFASRHNFNQAGHDSTSLSSVYTGEKWFKLEGSLGYILHCEVQIQNQQSQKLGKVAAIVDRW